MSALSLKIIFMWMKKRKNSGKAIENRSGADMKFKNIKVRRIIVIFIGCFLLSATLLIGRCNLHREADVWKDFGPALKENWAIVDGVIDGSGAYTIISDDNSRSFGNLFAVFRQKSDQQWELEYTNDFEELKPWKLELGDVNGDGITEILIAVRKTTHFDQEEKNRMFIFQYDGEKLIKTWTGSQAAGIWDDFLVGDLLPIKGDELVFVEQTEPGDEKLSVYYWFDFGFVRLAESEGFHNILSVSIPEENCIRMIYNNVWNRAAYLRIKDNKIVIESKKP